MFTVKKIKLVFASLLIIALSLSFLTSCSDEKARATITIEGVLADNNGQSAEGLNLVLVDEYNNDYSTKIGEGGKFTARGILPDTELALSVEGDDGRGYTRVSYFKLATSDSVSLGEMQGSNFKGYLRANCREDTEKLYITFYLDKNNYLAIRYLSDEGPEPATVTTETTTETTTQSNILF